MNFCKICNNSKNNKTYLVRETMFGLEEEFEYVECSDCGCLQLKNIPEDMSKYYPKDYYSLKPSTNIKNSLIKSIIISSRAQYAMNNKNILGMINAMLSGTPPRFEWFKKGQVSFDSAILEAGCGAGGLLVKLHNEGFSHLTGIDPFLENDIFFSKGFKILKKHINELNQKYDFIMLNHSFEHIPEQLKTLKELHHLLYRDRYLLIRIPLVSSFAWRKYGTNWYQLDAPRHLFLHTEKSMQLLADQAGFKIKEIVYDSTLSQFTRSEQCSQGITFVKHAKNKSVFSRKELKFFKRATKKLNMNHDGDQACFYLHKE